MNAEHEGKTVTAEVPQQRQTVLWVIAILLAVIATALVLRPDGVRSLQAAYGQTPMTGARGIFAFTGQLDRNSFGLFMMDVDSSNVWCYQYLPGRQRLRLVAARSFSCDRYLENYNCDEPTPKQVCEMLEDQRRIRDRIGRGGISAEESAEALSDAVPGMSTDSDEKEQQGREDD